MGQMRSIAWLDRFEVDHAKCTQIGGLLWGLASGFVNKLLLWAW